MMFYRFAITEADSLFGFTVTDTETGEVMVTQHPILSREFAKDEAEKLTATMERIRENNFPIRIDKV
jgi:hypothetical protein